jgi:D-alanyl-D-alanine carboxypeptidase/D-alanyl-D-alanine-endopeptidase (penicillin-binding protein 4)
MVLKGLAAAAGPEPGSTAAGIHIVRTTLAAAGVDLTGVEMRDGSGLADGNRATAAALVGTLVAFGRDFEVYPELLASLPIAGLDGTMEERDAAGRVRAKTGRLRGVDALSGYAAAPDGTVRAFSILVNDSPCDHDRVQPLVDRLAARIAGVAR